MTVAPFEISPPADQHVTSYDRQHLVAYLRLLDAADEGADWREAVHLIFELDAQIDPEHARQVYDNHLARARWMTAQGYRDLLQSPSGR